ncbi:hypothetical protein D3P06_03715 [Paracoccus aestuarii]|uniref:HTH-like domain-containing protein n=1 Tax=Paracoccus aestuarii TaxID=453842 RepID=A0A419A0L2_9RHOB|nr:hypothetical protein D3P06_03715 [Paracoccus aestuarii]
MGAHRIPDRHRKGQRRRTLRLPQGNPGSGGSRPSSGKDRRPAALELQPVKLKPGEAAPPLTENWRVYGVRKVWRRLGREGFDVDRYTIARLMKDVGIQALSGESRIGRRSLTGRRRVCRTR